MPSINASMMPRLFTADVATARPQAAHNQPASMMPRLFTADVWTLNATVTAPGFRFNDAAAVHRGCPGPDARVDLVGAASMMPRLFTADVPRSHGRSAGNYRRFNDAAAVHRGCPVPSMATLLPSTRFNDAAAVHRGCPLEQAGVHQIFQELQ